MPLSSRYSRRALHSQQGRGGTAFDKAVALNHTIIKRTTVFYTIMNIIVSYLFSYKVPIRDPRDHANRPIAHGKTS
jgi:hypothetical protein